MSTTNRCRVSTPLGEYTLQETDGSLTAALPTQSDEADIPLYGVDPAKTCSSVLQKAAGQLTEYFAGQRTEFVLPLSPQGTAFQRTVWDAMAAVPYGQTATYAQIAAAIGKPKAARAVGAACHRNPLHIILPCHRVVGAGGQLTGYAGGLNRKEYLLALEHNPLAAAHAAE